MSFYKIKMSIEELFKQALSYVKSLSPESNITLNP